MSFFRKEMMAIKHIKRDFFQKQIQTQIAPEFNPIIPYQKPSEERASRRALPQKAKESHMRPGMMTVEATLVLPLFLFAMVNILSLLLMFRSFSLAESKIHQTGRTLSLLAYNQGNSREADIRLVWPMKIQPLFTVVGFPSGYTVNGCVMHKWIGYDPAQGKTAAEDEKEEMVFITKSGTAYHRERSCVYLNPSVEMISRKAAKNAKNQDGRTYTPCEICGGNAETVYVTKDGIRYHSTINCSGLRRTINCVTLKEALDAGKHACPRCG